MTTRDQARPARSRPDAPAKGGTSAAGGDRAAAAGGDRAAASGRDSGSPVAPQPNLPERLLAARERKGVDLYRAERDTKIRAHYLAALERGDYRELPGAVYTKGFLRNYALYLGLDPDDVLAQWRSERGEAALPTAAISTPPRPLVAPRTGLTFSPGILVAALLTVAVVAFVAYLGVQLFRFAKPPTIAVTAPAAAVTDVEDGTTTYTFAGTSIAGATIEITASGRDQPYRAAAGPDGSWTTEVELSRGRNQFEVNAKDPDTGKTAEDPVERVILVPFPVIEAPTLAVDSPLDGATYENGAIPVTGRTTNATEVTVAATWRGPVTEPAVPEPSPSSPPTVEPQTVAPADDGSFSVPVELVAGRWTITVTAASAEGKTVSLARNVTVNFKGVNLVVSINGGSAWLKVWVDGKLADGFGAGGKTLRDGRTVTFTGETSVEVRTGNSGVTYFTLNGEALGALGRRGTPETWLFEPPAAPQQTGRK
jgi:cytoskeletal protein RodZ